MRKRWEAALETVAGLERETQQLTLHAPFDSTPQVRGEGLSPGTWLPRGEHVFDVVGPTGVKGEALVGEDDIGRVAVANAARFVASIAEMGTLPTLDEPAIASVYGGAVPAQKQPGTQQIVPLAATCRVRIGDCDEHAALGTATPGLFPNLPDQPVRKGCFVSPMGRLPGDCPRTFISK